MFFIVFYCILLYYIYIDIDVHSHNVIAPGKRTLNSGEAHIKTVQEYEKLYSESLIDPNKFWGKVSRQLLTWSKPFETVLAGSFPDGTNTCKLVTGNV